MRITNITQVGDFLTAVDESKDNVWLVSPAGDRINLKSKLCQYIGIAQLLGEHGDWFELFCDSKEDEPKFLKFFNEHPETLF